MNKFVALAIVILGFSCTPKKEINSFSDPTLVQIAEWQDRRQPDSIITYLSHKNPLYRERAALALGSVQDSAAAIYLGALLLDDSQPNVRMAAAFALGQTKSYLAANALIPSLVDSNSMVRRQALEALGKTIRPEDFETWRHFKPADSLDEEGFVWALYRIGVRGLLSDELAGLAAPYLTTSKSYATQLGVAHLFSRGNYVPPVALHKEIVTLAHSPYADVRMAIAGALRKTEGELALQTLQQLASDSDYRVRCNAVRSLRSFAWKDTQPLFANALTDANANVTIAAAEVIRALTTAANISTIRDWAQSCKNARAQAHLYEAVMKVNATEELLQEVKQLYQQASDDYQKAWLLAALSKSTTSISFFEELINSSSSASIIRSSAAAGLAEINRNSTLSNTERNELVRIYKNSVGSGDVGIVISVCEVLKDPALNYKSTLTDFQFLYDVRKKLSLPRDIEAIQPLEETIAYFEGRPITKKAQEFNHPIVWDSVKQIPKNQRVLIQTTKGEIELVLLVEEAPGSVLNFVQLIRQHYFDNKFFHRVVPNFVIQTGCKRGDGYGSEEYSIRSEFTPRKYKTGSVGMASAGKDTEGTQWFITHSPTPHLDGGYTIFAEVTKGMNIVHQIEVGDQIKAVVLSKN